MAESRPTPPAHKDRYTASAEPSLDPSTHPRVNGDDWRFRCPGGHAQVRWLSSSTTRCRTCGEKYDLEEIEDRKTGGTLADAVEAEQRPSAPAHVDATPTPEADEPAFEDRDPALRVGLGRYTVDLLPVADGQVPVVASNGELGTEPRRGTVDVAVAAALLEGADFVRAVDTIDTAAWPRADH